MKRGAPLKRTAWKRKPREQRGLAHAAAQVQFPAPAVEAPPVATKPVAKQRGTYASGPMRAAPKTIAHRNNHLREMAKGKPCLLCVPGVCTQDRATVVCCHSNSSTHGKAGSRRADDHYSVWGCFACHSWLDTGKAPAAAKTNAFIRAHLAQVLEWRAIAFDTRSAPKDRAAAQWALERLNATPVGETP